MIKFENTDIYGWEAAIRGMRNPKNSWDRSDSIFGISYAGQGYGDVGHDICRAAQIIDNVPQEEFIVGPNDHKLMMTLAKAGSEHRKYLRMINVTVDITAPLYWWKEFDTYKVGTVANSCSTMHKIAEKEFTWDDFSHEHLMNYGMGSDSNYKFTNKDASYAYALLFKCVIDGLNGARERYLDYLSRGAEYRDRAKEFWWQMIQLLPSSYNQKRTVQLNYEVLSAIYHQRKNHKLDEWAIGFINWIKELPYSELITLEWED